MTISGDRPAGALRLELPTWVPGDYSYFQFGRDLFGLRAADAKGNTLAISRDGWQAFEVEAAKGPVTVSYRAYAYGNDLSEPAGILDSDFGVILGARYLHSPALLGPCRVTYDLPKGWKVHHPSGAARVGTSTAWEYPSFEILLDTPVVMGDFDLRKRKIKGTTFYYAFVDRALGYDTDGRPVRRRRVEGRAAVSRDVRLVPVRRLHVRAVDEPGQRLGPRASQQHHVRAGPDRVHRPGRVRRRHPRVRARALSRLERAPAAPRDARQARLLHRHVHRRPVGGRGVHALLRVSHLHAHRRVHARAVLQLGRQLQDAPRGDAGVPARQRGGLVAGDVPQPPEVSRPLQQRDRLLRQGHAHRVRARRAAAAQRRFARPSLQRVLREVRRQGRGLHDRRHRVVLRGAAARSGRAASAAALRARAPRHRGHAREARLPAGGHAGLTTLA